MRRGRVVVAAPASLVDVGQVNWEACLFCQKTTGDLMDPSRNPIQSRRESGYETVGNNLELLLPYGYKLESGIPVESLRVYGGTETGENEKLNIADSLKLKRAKWHNNCKLPFIAKKFEIKLKHAKEQSSSMLAGEKSDGTVDNKYQECSSSNTKRVQTRATLPLVQVKSDVCFICKEPASLKYPLRHCATDNIYKNVKDCAVKLNDTALLAVLSEGDLVAIEAKYHLICLARLYNKVSERACCTSEDRERLLCEGIAFANLLLYIHTKLTENPNITFKMGDIRQSYTERLTQLLGIKDQSIFVHSTRFREKILAHFPVLTAQKSGREYILLKSDANLLTSLHKEDQDEDALAAQTFLQHVRKSIKASTVKFSGSFQENSEEACIPSSLLAVVNTLLYGSPVHSQCRATKPALTICQLLMLNYRETVPKGSIVRNKRDHEPPFPVYMALSTYGKSRDKGRIEEMHRYGISVSYNRINEVTSHICRRVVQEAKEKNILCPSDLRHGLFVAAAIDNIDHNPSSTSSKGPGFHGTGISIFQFPSETIKGTQQEKVVSFADVEQPGLRSVPELPDFYSYVPECTLHGKPNCPQIPNELSERMLLQENTDSQWQNENPWLTHTRRYLDDSVTNCEGVNVSFSSYHASKEKSTHTIALNTLLPLFPEKCEDPGMIKHAMNIIKNITAYLNGNQAPVICGDQPTYALLKTIQWKWPELYGSFVALLGPLHIEKAFLRVLGQYAEGSGWCFILANSGIATIGSAEGFLKVFHIMKARAAHQKTAVALFSLLNDAYENTCEFDTISLQDWAEERAEQSPTFKFWFTLMNMQIILLIFVKSVREGNFDLYKRSLKNMVPFFFSMNHPQYARWLPVHISDMENLQQSSPDTYQQFAAGNFVVHKSSKPFSALGLDHAHEQNNAAVKARGGVIGLTEDASALRRWTIGGPEVQRLLSEFGSRTDEEAEVEFHHEQTPGFQRTFADHCFALKESFLQFENPFFNDTSELIILDSRCVASEEAVHNLRTFEAKGRAAYEKFVQERLLESKSCIHDKIPQIKWQIFTIPPKKVTNPTTASLKDQLSLFIRLFIICQARDFNLDEFFRHENQHFPPSLSEDGFLRSGNKALLVPILEKLVGNVVPPKKFDGIVVDGPGLMYELKPTQAGSLSEYFEKVLMPFINTYCNTYAAKAVAVAWDLYFSDTIKKARQKRGEGVRQQDLPRKGGMPKNWESYLKNSANKTELFTFLGEKLVESCKHILLVTNIGEKYSASIPSGSRLPGKSCATKEEADPRIVLHVKDLVEHGAQNILVRSNDTDVIVLCTSFYPSLKKAGLRELWFMYGVGAKRRFIAIHAISDALGPKKSVALRGFHAYTGGDGTSFFASKGKPSAWSAWKDDAEITEAFIALSNPTHLTEDGNIHKSVVAALEKYTILLYGGDPTCENIDVARRTMFCSGDKPLTAIPPTSAALLQHIKRSAYQGGYVWGTADQVDYIPPSPEKFGWVLQDGCLQPLWSTLPHIWEACRELDRCGCASDCSTRRCLCRKHTFPCSPACKKCKGECSNRCVRTPAAVADEENPED